MEDALLTFLNLLNEMLAAAIVVVAVSMLLYNLTRHFNDRVSRTSASALAWVTVSYVADVFRFLDPTPDVEMLVLRFQWIGIGFIPAALFHLSDALLATTGLPSRGRRRRVVRILYIVGAVFVGLALATNFVVQPVMTNNQIGLRSGPFFPIYLAYFLVASGSAFINVNRARQRCRTRSTKRRMAYLQFAMLTPAVGIFPYSIFLGPGEEFSLLAQILVNLGNVVVILMLIFLAYPLSFFGSRVPDRVVKAELLRFMLRGPATGLLILGVIIFTRPASEILGLPGDSFMPFAVVAVILFWLWMVDLWIPWLEKRLIYPTEDDDQLSKVERLSRQLLTRADLIQLQGAILEASCDFMHVDTAFIASLTEGRPEIMQFTGEGEANNDLLNGDMSEIVMLNDSRQGEQPFIHAWRSYWLMPLYSRRSGNGAGNNALIGIMGIQARTHEVILTEEEADTLETFRRRAARTLDDINLQSEIYAALEGLLPQLDTTRERAAEFEYKPGYTPLPPPSNLPDREQMIEQVGAALRHYYGGPGLTKSRLLELVLVRSAMDDNDNNTIRALRAVLDRSIENQRPEGERDLKSQEWLLYNILTERFIKKRRVRDVARSLYISEANLYRKQNLAIEAVADTLLQMEQEAQAIQFEGASE